MPPRVYYLDLKRYRRYLQLGETPFTPAVSTFFALDAALDELLHEGLPRRRQRYQRLHVLLRREGFAVNVKRVYRLYKEEGLSVRKRTRKRLKGCPRKDLQAPTRPGEQWAMDLTSDALADGRAGRPARGRGVRPAGT